MERNNYGQMHVDNHSIEKQNPTLTFNPFSADPVKALHFAILV